MYLYVNTHVVHLCITADALLLLTLANPIASHMCSITVSHMLLMLTAAPAAGSLLMRPIRNVAGGGGLDELYNINTLA